MAAAAKVISVQGEAFARSANGTMRRLAAGDSIEQGEVVITSAGGAAELRTADGQMMSINSQESFKFGPESTQATAPSAGEAAVVAGAPAATVIQPGEINVEQLLADEAAAAGLGGGGENGGNSFVRLMRISEELTPLSYVFPNSGAGELLPFEGVGGDDAPVAGADIALADEDGEGFTFREVNPGGDGDVDAPATMTGRMNYDFGNDGPAAVGAFRWTGVTLPGGTPITSGGSLVEFESLNDGLELSGFIMVDGVKQEVFEVVVTNPETGEYTFTLFRPLDHLEQGEDDLNLVFNYQLQDKDGDLANGTLSATINDDTPVADAKNASDTVTVEDEKMQDELGRLFTDEEDGGVGTITGTIVDNAKWGADGFGGVTGFDVGDQHFDPGTTVYWDQYGNFLGTNTPDSPPPVDPEITAQARGEDYEDYEEKIFPAAQLIVNDDGTYTFTLLDNMLMGQDVDGEQEDFLSTVTINAQDGDGDLLNVDINLQVQDDKPELVWGEGEDNEGQLLSVTVTVDEDDIRTDLSLGTSPNDGAGWPSYDGSYTGPAGIGGPGPANVSGSVAALVSFGADGPGDNGFSLSDDFDGLDDQGLTSAGEGLDYRVVGNTLEGFVEGNGEDVSERVVFTLQLDIDGTYTFSLYDQLDHEPPYTGNGEDDDYNDYDPGNTLPIDLSSVIVATDGDGDSITLKGNFTINITDDAPEMSGKRIIATVQENDIDTDYSLGTSPNDGNRDGSFTGSQLTGESGPAVVSGDLSGLVKFGADGEGSFGFTSSALQQLQSTDWSFWAGGYVPVNVDFRIDTGSGTETLVAYERLSDPGTSNTVFELELNTTNGAYEFRLYDELRHTGDTPDTIALNFGALIEAQDGDNDPITLGKAFTINVKDDVPEPVINLTGVDVQHDETPNNQPTPDDDTSSISVATRFNGIFGIGGVSNTGNDPDVAGSGAIGFARSGSSVVSTSGSEAGADHLKSDALSLEVVGNGVSGLQTTEGYNIMLSVDSLGRVVGRVDGGPMNGKAAFAIALDQDGEVFVAQYLSLKHPTTTNVDETIDLAGKVQVRYSMTDTDGDTRSDTVDIGAKISFADDGPALSGTSITATVQENDIDTDYSLGTSPNDGNADGSFTDSQWTNESGPAVVSGDLSGLVKFGADGEGSFGFTSSALQQLQSTDWQSSFWGGGYVPVNVDFKIEYGAGTETLVAYERISDPGTSNTVFELELNTTNGAYEFRLYDELRHTGDTPDSIALNFGALIEAQDGDNDPVTLGQSFTINVVDDVPVLANDSKTIDEDYLNGNKYISVSGNVLDNDKVGADHLGSLKWLDNNGKYGSFDGDSDGSYSYNPNNASLQYLDSKESVTETFRYTVKDTDGDLKEATLTITITGSNDAPTISVNTGNWWNWNDEVDEEALASGSNYKSTDEFAYGTFTVADPDGLDDIKTVTINGLELPITGMVGKHIDSSIGTLTITGYDAKSGEASYKYELTKATYDGKGDETDTFTLTTSDGDLTSDKATITIEINDDRPYARPDTGAVTEGATLTVNAADGVLDNDTLGADGAAVNGVRLATYNSKGYLITTDATGGVDADIAGKYGTLHLNADGSYTYDTDPNTITKGGIDTFVYTIRDGDGDLSTTTLKIDVADVTLKVSAWSDSINNGIHDITYPGSHSKDGKATDRDNQTEEFTVTSTPWENAASGGTKDSSTWPEIETAMEERKWIDRDGNSILTTNQPQPITITHDATMTLTFEEVGAGYNNAIGWYKIGATGPEEGQILWYSATGFSPGGTVLPSHTVSVPVEAGDKIGFFLIPNANLPQNMDGEEVTFANGHAFINGVQIDSVGDTDPVWFTNPTAGSVLNSDQVQHAVVGTVDGLPSHELYVGFEDLVGGGDKDYNDFVFKVDLGEGNDVNFNPVVFNLGVDLPDVALSQATIDFTLMDGDTISWDAGVASKYGLTVNEDATTHDVTITANDSAGSVRIEDLLDTFQVTVNNVPGGDKDHPVSYADRTAEVSVMDVYGNLSNEADAIFRLEQPSKEV